MKPYGKKTNGPKIAAHGDKCGICRPPQKNKKKRARREAKKIVHTELCLTKYLLSGDPECPACNP